MRPLRPDETAISPSKIHDCWNSIGVRGDRSCPQLTVHAHCNNCPAFSSAAASLLDQLLPAEAAEEGDWRRAYAAYAAPQQRATRSALLVRLGGEWFALPMLALDQVIEFRRVHSLPHRRNSPLLGLVNVRGELLTCVSLALLLGVDGALSPESDEQARAQRMVVIRSGGGRVVFPVDEVEHHCRFHDEAVRPLPVTARISASSYTTGLIEAEGRLAALVDEDRLGQAVERCLA